MNAITIHEHESTTLNFMAAVVERIRCALQPAVAMKIGRKPEPLALGLGPRLTTEHWISGQLVAAKLVGVREPGMVPGQRMEVVVENKAKRLRFLVPIESFDFLLGQEVKAYVHRRGHVMTFSMRSYSHE